MTDPHDLLIEHDELLAKLSDVLWNNGFNKVAREVDAARERLYNFFDQPEPEEEWYSRFGDWLEREMPEGTVIGDPLWWASKIADYLARWGK